MKSLKTIYTNDHREKGEEAGRSWSLNLPDIIVVEGGRGVQNNSQHGPFWRMSTSFGTRDRLCICPLFVSISD